MAKKIKRIEDLAPDPANANKGTERGLRVLDDSLRKYGAGRSILADKNGVVIAGNKTLARAADIGLPVRVVETNGKELVVVQRTDLDIDGDPKARELAYADNRSSEVSLDWDLEQIKTDLEAGIDLKGFWREDELGEMLAELQGENLPPVEDEGPGEPPETPVVKRGDLFVLGGHKLLCGDSTVQADVERVMAGERAALCFTSPPYGEQRKYEGNLKPWDELMQGVFSILPMADDGQVLVNLGLIHRDGEWIPYWDGWIEFMRQAGWKRFGWYVWDKLEGLPGDWNGRLRPSHEWIFHFCKIYPDAKKISKCKHAGKIQNHTGMRNVKGEVCSKWTQRGEPIGPTKVIDSVVRCSPCKGGIGDHPAPFSVELAILIIDTYSANGELVFEPFLGSGTTMIAAEQTGRRCFGIEIAERYVQVILDRWCKATGKEAYLQNDDGTQTPWSEMKGNGTQNQI